MPATRKSADSNAAADLFAKLEAMTIDPDGEISESDVAFCEAAQSEYDVVASRAVKIAEMLSSLEREAKGFDDDNEEYPGLRKDVEDGVSGIMEELAKVNQRFYDKIVSHFSRSYAVSLSQVPFTLIGKGIGGVKWKDVVAAIVGHVGSAGLRGAGENSVIDGFRRHCIKHYDHNPDPLVYNGERGLRMEGMYMVSKDYNGVPAIDYGEPRKVLGELLAALEYFESGALELGITVKQAMETLLRSRSGNGVVRTWDFGLSKVESVRLYLNRRVDIKFASRSARDEFIGKFNLSSLVKQ